MCRISTSPSAEAGSRPAIEARNSRVNPGTRSRLPSVTRSVVTAMVRSLRPVPPACEGFGPARIRGRYDRAVITYRFGAEDLGRVRFAISPLFEIAASLDVLRDPSRHAMHAPWVAIVRERLAGLDLALLEAVVPEDTAYRPDFVHPPPERPRAGFAAELARVRATPPEQVARDLGWAYEGRELAARRARGCSRTRRGGWRSSPI